MLVCVVSNVYFFLLDMIKYVVIFENKSHGITDAVHSDYWWACWANDIGKISNKNLILLVSVFQFRAITCFYFLKSLIFSIAVSRWSVLYPDHELLSTIFFYWNIIMISYFAHVSVWLEQKLIMISLNQSSYSPVQWLSRQ